MEEVGAIKIQDGIFIGDDFASSVIFFLIWNIYKGLRIFNE